MDRNVNEESLISVIMPAYNAEKYIIHAIKSVIEQTYHNWELIIVDDASSDKTVNLIKEMSMIDARIKLYLNPKNMGVSDTRNKAIDLANGQWIAFLDSDDLWKENKLEKQMSLTVSNDAEFIFTGVAYINESGESYKGIFEVPKIITYKKLLKQNLITCSSVLMKRKFFGNVKMENDRMHEDYAVWLKVLKENVVGYGVNEPLVIYRISPNSKSGNKLKTFKMTYMVFSSLGISSVKSIFYTLSHVFGAYKKYRKIKPIIN